MHLKVLAITKKQLIIQNLCILFDIYYISVQVVKISIISGISK